MISALFQSIVTVDDFRVFLSFNRGKRTLNQKRLDVNVGTADMGGLLIFGALVVLRSKARPRTKFFRSRKDRHIHANFTITEIVEKVVKLER